MSAEPAPFDGPIAARHVRPPGIGLYAIAWSVPVAKLLLVASLALRHGQPSNVQDVFAVLPEVGVSAMLLLAAQARGDWLVRRLLLLIAALLALVQWIAVGAWAFAGAPVSYGLLARLAADPQLRRTVMGEPAIASVVTTWLTWMLVSWSITGTCIVLLRRRLRGRADHVPRWLLAACVVASLSVTASQPVRPELRLALAAAWAPTPITGEPGMAVTREAAAESALGPPERPPVAAAPTPIRNVLLVVLESMRYDARRPFLPDVAGAVRVERAYAHHPRSVKTLEALMFGVYPSLPLDTAAWNIERYDVGATSLPRRLQPHGFRSYYIGATALDSDNYDDTLAAAGIDDATAIQTRAKGVTWGASARDVFDRAAAVLEAGVGFSDRRFVVAWTAECHMPYDFVAVQRAPFADSRERYYACQGSLADDVRALLQRLERRGLLRETMVVVMGDHGEAFDRDRAGEFGHGIGMMEVSLRVPMLWFVPGVAARRDDRLFQPVDVPATILSALGVPVPSHWPGRDILSPDGPGREFIVAHSLMSDGQAAVVDVNGEKIVRRLGQLGMHRFDLVRDAEEQYPHAVTEYAREIAVARMNAYERLARAGWAALLARADPVLVPSRLPRR